MSKNLFLKKYIYVFYTAIFATIIAVSFTINTKPTQAFGLPFGGMIYWTFPCTCPASAGNRLVYMGLPRPGLYTYSAYASIPYSNYLVAPGSWVLGNYTPGPQICWMVGYPSCWPYPNLGLINMIGTSL